MICFFEQAQGRFRQPLRRIAQAVFEGAQQLQRPVGVLQNMLLHHLERQLARRRRGRVEQIDERARMLSQFGGGWGEAVEKVDPALGDAGPQRALQLAQNQGQQIGARQTAVGEPAQQTFDDPVIEQRLENTLLGQRLVLQTGQNHFRVKTLQLMAEKSVPPHRHAHRWGQGVRPFGMPLARFQHQPRHALIAAGKPHPLQHLLEHAHQGVADPRFGPIQHDPPGVKDELLGTHRLPGAGLESAGNPAFARQPRPQQIQAAVKGHQSSMRLLGKQAAMHRRVVERARRGQRSRPIAQKTAWIGLDRLIEVGQFDRPRV